MVAQSDLLVSANPFGIWARQDSVRDTALSVTWVSVNGNSVAGKGRDALGSQRFQKHIAVNATELGRL
jgi:hypothetical protein